MRGKKPHKVTSRTGTRLLSRCCAVSLGSGPLFPTHDVHAPHKRSRRAEKEGRKGGKKKSLQRRQNRQKMCVKMSVERHSHAHAHGCIHRSCHTSGLRFTSGCARNKTLLRNQHQRRRQQQDRRRACWWRKRRMRMRRRRTAGKISIPTASVPERRGRGVGGGSRSDVMRRCSGFLSMRRFLCCFLSVEFFLFPPSGVFPSLHPVACCCWCGGVNKSLEPRGPGVPVAVCVCSVCLLACLCFFARVRFLAAWRPVARTRVSSTRFSEFRGGSVGEMEGTQPGVSSSRRGGALVTGSDWLWVREGGGHGGRREGGGVDEGGGGETVELRAKSPGGKDIEFVMLQMFGLD